MLNCTFSTNRIYCAVGVWNISRKAEGEDKHTVKQWNNTQNRKYHKYSSAFGLRPGLCGDNPLPQIDLLTGDFPVNHLTSTNNFTKTTKRQHIQMQTNATHKGALIHSNTLTKKPRLRVRSDRAWFSCLLWHPTRKWSRSILSTQEPARGPISNNLQFHLQLIKIFYQESQKNDHQVFWQLKAAWTIFVISGTQYPDTLSWWMFA